MRSTFYEDDSIKVSLEQFENKVFVHLKFYKVSKKTVKWVDDIFTVLKDKLFMAGWDEIYTYTEDDRVPKMFLGEYVGEDNDAYGRNWKVYKWVLNLY